MKRFALITQFIQRIIIMETILFPSPILFLRCYPCLHHTHIAQKRVLLPWSQSHCDKLHHMNNLLNPMYVHFQLGVVSYMVMPCRLMQVITDVSTQCYFILKIEVIFSSWTQITTYKPTWCHKPDHHHRRHWHHHDRDNLQYRSSIVTFD